MRPPDSEKIASQILDRFTPEAEAQVPAGPRPPRAAVIAFHGMGQQARYETLAATADALQRALVDARRPRPAFDAYLSGDGDGFVPRLQLRIQDENGREHEVHLYEVYWAPITVGRIGTLETFTFLVTAGLDAIRRRATHVLGIGRGRAREPGQRPFSRFLFEEWRDLEVSGRTQAGLLLTVVVLLLLGAMNAVVVAAAASRVLTWNSGGWPSGPLLQDLTLDFLVLVAVVFPSMVLGVKVPQWLRDVGRERGAPRTVARPLIRLAWGFVALALATVVVVGTLVLSHVVRHATPDATPQWQGTPLWGLVAGLSERPAPPSALLVMFGVWALVIVLAWGARRFLSQFVGDVAIYISAHSANRFHGARDAIQQEASKVARHVYGLREPAEGDAASVDAADVEDEAVAEPEGAAGAGGRGERPRGRPYYDRVLFVGHSLGSVIAYDTLNAVLRSQIYSRAGDRILERTRGLVTFGSPLDKTAYIFRGQARQDYALREVLAATWQPLIRKYKYRPPSWINLHSPNDPISGRLDYYDIPERKRDSGDRCVEDVEDECATTPMLAHNEYWTGRRLGEVLLREVTCDDAPPETLA